jgi:ATP-binding cassette subfamily D (ALD) long-chain fatty acid import protein
VLPPSPSLAKYHTQLLTLSGDGTGNWTLARIGTAEARIGIDREIGMLESRLKEVEQWERRIKELEVLLGPQGATPA